MSTFKVQFQTENSAFDCGEGEAAFEVARILRDLAKKVESQGDCRMEGTSIMDANGNKVGVMTWK